MPGKIKGRRRGRQRMKWLDGIINSMDEFEQTSGDSEGQRGLVCCSPWGHKESDKTERLNNTNNICENPELVEACFLKEALGLFKSYLRSQEIKDTKENEDYPIFCSLKHSQNLLFAEGSWPLQLNCLLNQFCFAWQTASQNTEPPVVKGLDEGGDTTPEG